MKRLELTLGGMECCGCALDLETLLLRLDGIIDVRISSREETAEVTYDEERILERQVISAIKKAGLTVSRKS